MILSNEQEEELRAIEGAATILDKEVPTRYQGATPMLECINHPIYDTHVYPDDVQSKGAGGRMWFWRDPIGSRRGDKTRTWRDTNLRRDGALHYPQQFDMTGILIVPDLRDFQERYYPAVREAVETVRRSAVFNFDLGVKSCLRVPAEVVFANVSVCDDPREPAGEAPDYDWKGLEPLSRGYNVEVALHIPSEQQVTPSLEFESMPKIPFKLPIRLYLIGTWKREVA